MADGDQPSSVNGTVRRPFTEQIAFFRGKLGNLVPTERWDDVEREAHDTAFMVAGAQKADLLSDLAMAVDRSIAEGKSLEAFRQDFRSIVAKNGWHGWTGEETRAGRAWRTRTIYRTNASTSYSAGRYAQLMEGDFPLWVYRHGGSKEPRIEHLELDGIYLPPDHDFWRIYYPPSDWGCSCYAVGARSERAAKRLGGVPGKKLPAWVGKTNPRTGAPYGTGRNWNYAPGATVAPIVNAAAWKISDWDYRIAKGFMESVPEALRDQLAQSYRTLPSVADDARRYAANVWESVEVAPQRTLGLLGPRQAAKIADIVPPGKTPLDLFDFSVSGHGVEHIRAKHGSDATERPRGQRAVTPDDFALLPEIIEHPDSVEAAGIARDGEQLINYVKQIGDETYVATFAVRRGRRTLGLLTFFIRQRKSAASAQRP